MTNKPIVSLVILSVILFFAQSLIAREDYKKLNKTLIKQITSTDGFVALWKFNEKPEKTARQWGRGIFL